MAAIIAGGNQPAGPDEMTLKFVPSLLNVTLDWTPGAVGGSGGENI